MIFLCFEPLVAPLLFLIFAWATEDVVKNEIGWDIGWAWWVIVAALIVFVLTYRDVRISTRAGIVLGAIEIVIFLGLSIWMLVSNFDQLNMRSEAAPGTSTDSRARSAKAAFARGSAQPASALAQTDEG